MSKLTARKALETQQAPTEADLERWGFLNRWIDVSRDGIYLGRVGWLTDNFEPVCTDLLVSRIRADFGMGCYYSAGEIC
jgi:hypothetical protein